MAGHTDHRSHSVRTTITSEPITAHEIIRATSSVISGGSDFQLGTQNGQHHPPGSTPLATRTHQAIPGSTVTALHPTIQALRWQSPTRQRPGRTATHGRPQPVFGPSQMAIFRRDDRPARPRPGTAFVHQLYAGAGYTRGSNARPETGRRQGLFLVQPTDYCHDETAAAHYVGPTRLSKSATVTVRIRTPERRP